MSINNNYLIAVVGPTAIGKTALAIELAQHFKSEIISCDSRQFYKEMTIGTAVPFESELQAVSHHFIQNKNIDQAYSVGDFEREALSLLDGLFEKNRVQVLVGGSGLFVNALLFGLDEFPTVDPQIREQLNRDLETYGIGRLQEQLLELDPVHYSKVALQNPQRLIRALEVCLGSGQAYSSFLNKKAHQRNFTPVIIGLEADRTLMYNRINTRVEQMMKAGLLDEVRALEEFQHLNALQTVGYRELFAYLNGEYSLEFALSEIQKNSRRFAKRQLTWFKKLEKVHWFDTSVHRSEIIQKIESQIL